MTTPSPTTIDVVGTRPFTAQVDAPRVLDHKRRQSSAGRQLSRALDAVKDVAALLLVVLLIPFVILAICSPVVLTLWAVLALIHRL